MLIDYDDYDRKIYENELKDFLPKKIFDAHVHLFDTTCMPVGYEFPKKSCFQKFGCKFMNENWQAYMGKLLPGHDIYMNSFGHPELGFDLSNSATYTGKISDNERNFGMALVSPKDQIEEIKKRMLDNQLVGYKPYLNFVDWKDKNAVMISDMLPAEQMEYADAKGLAITLHIPRLQRLGDPLNQKQMVELCHHYPNAKIIFAHIGRAYYLKNIIGNLDGIAACPNAYIDTAMVNHEDVLSYAFDNFPRERILFGSDAPIALLKGKSVEINNQYAYLMAEDYQIGTAIYDTGNVVLFTSFYYEQLRGIKQAAERTGLSRAEIEGIFFNNAFSLFKDIADKNYGSDKL